MGGLALVHPLGSYLEVDLDDMRSENQLLDAIGCDGALQLNLPSVNSLIRYLVDPRTFTLL